MPIINCPDCGHRVSTSAATCPSCGRPIMTRVAVPTRGPGITGATTGYSWAMLAQVTGVLGACCLIVGVFLPFISMPLMGSQSYFANGKGDGVILLVVGGVAFILGLSRKFCKWEWVPGLAGTGMLVWAFITFQKRIGEMKGQLTQAKAKGDMFASIGETVVDLIKLEWGWGVLILGTILLFASTFFCLKEPAMRKR